MTGNKGANNFASPSFNVEIAGKRAIVKDGVEFFYGLRWSNPDSWGNDAPPRAGDSVYVPPGQTVIVDQNSPKELNAVIVEGTLIFEDGAVSEFHANYIIVRNGRLIIGTED